MTPRTVDPAEVVRLREHGLKFQVIAKRLHVSKTTCMAACRELRPDLCDRTPARNQAEAKARELGYPSLRELLTQMAADGKHLNEMAEALGAPSPSVYTWLNTWHISRELGKGGRPKRVTVQPEPELEPEPEPELEPEQEPPIRPERRDWRKWVDSIPYIPRITRPGPVKLTPNERWCKCGETMTGSGFCYRCGSNAGGIDPRKVLLPGEWI